MKKVILVAVMAFLSANLFAQVFIGGSLGVATQSSTDRLANARTSQFAFTLSPNVGFKINDDMSVGGRIGFTVGSRTVGTVVTPDPTVFSIQPYFRYSLLTFGDFAVAGEANVGMAFQSSKNVITTPGAPDVTNKSNTTQFSLGVTPVLLYQLNKHVTLEANLNILTIGFATSATKATTETGGATTTVQDDTQSSFVTAANANDVFGGGWGLIQIGFTYAF